MEGYSHLTAGGSQGRTVCHDAVDAVFDVQMSRKKRLSWMWRWLEMRQRLDCLRKSLNLGPRPPAININSF